MRISQINAMNQRLKKIAANRNNGNEPTKTDSSIQPNFKGLWGKESIIDNIDYKTYSGSETTNRDYYPFLDESSEEIQAIKEEFSKTSVNHNGGQGSVYYYQNCHIKNKLPFTTSEWTQYIKNKFNLNRSTRIFIEEALKRNDLKKYLIK